MKSLATILNVFILAALSLTAAAENSTHTGGYTIHHNALTTDNLPRRSPRPMVCNAARTGHCSTSA